MSDDKDTAQAAGEQQANQNPIAINGLYTKDMSFEAPNTPEIFGKMQNAEPKIGVSVDVNASRLNENTFESTLQLRVEAKVGDDTAFLLELTYSGNFTVNVPQEHLEPALLIECPRILFPFARNIVCDATRDGGFPPLMLQPIDFVNMYQQRVAQARAAQEAAGEEEASE
ncbi:MAG: protein-export chaperone SecB [Alphaproteobacteria bacterium]|nr:protein-export chaperone SecB [Rhodospirillales bacterium]MCW9045899.1 protein-export chaperone SecB [Alphaproteobacteria bacterium]